ncbi:MAG TPA: malto-oligosyltrehalose synthase [Candidatus Sulfotelmatobacter sp.]|nr:malto-oligosyltrehalose synthase [Candidatus Sulfotelmatobacter sp.]
MIASTVASAEQIKPLGKATGRTCPRATYRLQFNEHFRLADALALVPYLQELGISHVYASPLFKAAAHSVHGYDVCDFGRLNPELGTDGDLEKLASALRERKMGLVLDIVPNHMGIATPENEWWQDVLKNGRASQFADHFDIQWDTVDPKLRGKILVPVLGDHYERVLERGELKIETDEHGPVICYFEHRFPISPESIGNEFSTEALNSNPAALNELIEKQHYCLAFWGEGDLRLNYRRFFAVSTLAAVRVEDETVFNDVHALLGQWLKKNLLDGLRVDHPDGLRDPKKYLDQLRALAPRTWMIVEKILQPGEEMPDDWPVEGTVGYDFLNEVNGLFIQAKNEKALTDFYSGFTGEPMDTGKTVREKKVLVLETLFATEVNRLLDLLAPIAKKRAPHKEFTGEQLREALIEFAACFPVYRTYVRPEDGVVNESDLRNTKYASAQAARARRDLPAGIFEFLRGLVSLTLQGETESEFVARFQQLTGPAMAKGVEDTTFYCLNYFTSLNEVGGDPGRFGVSVDDFHDFCRRQQERGGYSMLCSSTHDTKRSEDVRARLNVISEMPEEWVQAVSRWSKMNEKHRKNHFPDRNAEYLFYQTLAGAWPISFERILAYMEKASCEAKQHTDWNHRNPQYDSALKHFVTAVLADKDFLRDLETFLASFAEAAYVNGLAQTLIKLTAPGVSDIYQGNEIQDFSLVDPDNRRPVNFQERIRLLDAAKRISAEESWKRRDEGMAKLWLIRKTLAYRARHEATFAAEYEPIHAGGENADDIVAFLRGGKVMTVVPRFNRSRAGGLPTLLLPRGMWRNEFTEEMFIGEIATAKLFRKFPVALLVQE